MKCELEQYFRFSGAALRTCLQQIWMTNMKMMGDRCDKLTNFLLQSILLDPKIKTIINIDHVSLYRALRHNANNIKTRPGYGNSEVDEGIFGAFQPAHSATWMDVSQTTKNINHVRTVWCAALKRTQDVADPLETGCTKIICTNKCWFAGLQPSFPKIKQSCAFSESWLRNTREYKRTNVGQMMGGEVNVWMELWIKGSIQCVWLRNIGSFEHLTCILWISVRHIK